ncbi:MAG: hypothetical protein JNJ69_10240 [Leptospiraceae bacterium]|nr:hypothetical protein [Leptospiraceae bacterium]
MKKLATLLSLVAALAFMAPAFAQDTDPTTPPAGDPEPVECKDLKGEAKKECKKKKRKERREERKEKHKEKKDH